MKYFIPLLAMILLGCTPAPTTVVVDGNVYKKISPANGNQVELWEKKGDTNRYYTPSLEWMVHTNLTPSFNALPR